MLLARMSFRSRAKRYHSPHRLQSQPDEVLPKRRICQPGNLNPTRPAVPLCHSKSFSVDAVPQPFSLHSMSEHRETNHFPATQTHRPARSRTSIWLILLALFAASGQTIAQTIDDDYLQIYFMVQEADTLTGIGQSPQALPKYQKAQKALEQFRAAHPEWNPKIVAYRLSYVSNRLASVSQQDTGSSGAAGATAASPVKLLESGAEPRKQLRLHPKEGDKQTLELTAKTTTEVKNGDTQIPSPKLPPMKLVMAMTVKQVAPSGDISYDRNLTEAGIVEDPDVLPQVAEAMQSSLAGLKGLTAMGVISSRGIVKSADVKIPASVSPQMRQAVEQAKQSIGALMVPLPEEPVGVGAKWEYRRPFAAQGLTVDQTGTYEVVSIEEDRVTLKAALTQTAANQKIQNPMLPGAAMEVQKMTGEGTGNFTVDLGQTLPVDATTDVHADLSMQVAIGGQKQAMNMTTDVNMRLESK
jgi:hypothetical protein